jgi:hypothetical protein
MKKSLLLVLLLAGCASLGGARHYATVSVVSAESTLATIQDTELLLVCGKPGAPPLGTCVPLPLHKSIQAKLSTAFGLSGDLGRLVKTVQPDQPFPGQVGELIGQITTLVNDILALIPQSPQKAHLSQQLGAK